MEYARERQATVLSRMLDNGVITKEQEKAALDEQLTFAQPETIADSSPAPHFAEMVLADLNKRYEKKVARSGYQVKTTLDMNIQNKLQEQINVNMPSIRAEWWIERCSDCDRSKDGLGTGAHRQLRLERRKRWQGKHGDICQATRE